MAEPYIVFQVDESTYAVPSAQVQQVEMIEQITRVPNSPPFVAGIVYVRGQVVPVVNLRQRFGLEKIPYNLSARLIVTRVDGRLVGLAVDSAREFIRIESEDILPPPETLAGPAIEYLQGIVSQPERTSSPQTSSPQTSSPRLILLIDLEKLLSYQEKTALVNADQEGVYNNAQLLE